MIHAPLYHVQILPGSNAAHDGASPAESLRLTRWLIAGLVFLAIFLISNALGRTW